MVNENGISNVMVDVDFLDTEFAALGKEKLATSFTELRQVILYTDVWLKESHTHIAALCFTVDYHDCSRQHRPIISAACSTTVDICGCQSKKSCFIVGQADQIRSE